MTDGRTQAQGKSASEEERYEKEGSGEGGSDSGEARLPSNADEERLFRLEDASDPDEPVDTMRDSPAQS